MSVTFVLSGGASLGAIQVGMLRALAAYGIRPDAIVGASVGTVNGAFIALRGCTTDTLDELADIWVDLRDARRPTWPRRAAGRRRRTTRERQASAGTGSAPNCRRS